MQVVLELENLQKYIKSLATVLLFANYLAGLV